MDCQVCFCIVSDHPPSAGISLFPDGDRPGFLMPHPPVRGNPSLPRAGEQLPMSVPKQERPHQPMGTSHGSGAEAHDRLVNVGKWGTGPPGDIAPEDDSQDFMGRASGHGRWGGRTGPAF